MPDVKPPFTMNTSKAVTVTTLEPPGDPPVKVAPAPPAPDPPYHGLSMPDRIVVELCPREYRPPGEIMAQDTGATGVWARIAGKEWVKTWVPTIRQALALLAKAKTAESGVALLLAWEVG